MQVHLDAVAFLNDAEIPYYEQAKIIEVRELPVRAAARTAYDGEWIDTRGGTIVRHCGVVTGVR